LEALDLRKAIYILSTNTENIAKITPDEIDFHS
jgi:hypothetical protein